MLTFRLGFLFLGLSFLLCSCQSRLQTYNHHICCLSRPFSGAFENNVRVALVLSGGGARGIAHVGVLEVLEEADIPIDLIIGCSAGSLVGSLYASHPSASWIKEELSQTKRGDFLTFDFFTKCYGLSRGSGLKKFLLGHLGTIHFEDLEIPLIVAATDLCSGELVCFGQGPVAPSVHASCALPFVFSPVIIGERIFVDGGVVDPIPVQLAKDFAPQIIIAVDLCALLPDELPSNLFGVAKRCHEIQILSQSAYCSRQADVIIQPDLRNVGTFDDSCHENSLEAGRRAARKALPHIAKLLKETSENDR